MVAEDRIEPKEMIDALVEMGVTKWKISKTVGVHWNTVRNWEKGFMTPTPENADKIWEMLVEYKKEWQK